MSNALNWLAAAVIAVSAPTLLRGSSQPHCAAYTQASQPLVAHAGGGLPDRTYANDREAIDLAARHGFRLLEMDFMERDGHLTIGHDGMPESSLTISELLNWLAVHPGIRVITDVKTDNVQGLSQLAKMAGPMRNRFIPQIYSTDQYPAVAALGYPAQILTVYILPQGFHWQSAANALPLFAVTVPVDRRNEAVGVRHPIFLHTVNEPMPGYGLYTDCLVPAGRSGAASSQG